MNDLPIRVEGSNPKRARRAAKSATLVAWCFLCVIFIVFIVFIGWLARTLAPSSDPGMANASIIPSCVGDCDDDGVVTVDEIVLLVNIVLGISPISSCPTLVDPPDVADVVLAINAALTGCAGTSTPTASPIPTKTPIIMKLLEGSSIEYSSGVVTTPIQSEPLVGTFVLANPGFELQFAILDVLDVSMRSESFTISPGSPGVTGTVRLPLVVPPLFSMEMVSLVNGLAVAFDGEVALPCCGFPQEIRDLNMCGVLTEAPASCADIQMGSARGYILRVFAAPE